MNAEACADLRFSMRSMSTGRHTIFSCYSLIDIQVPIKDVVER